MNPPLGACGNFSATIVTRIWISNFLTEYKIKTFLKVQRENIPFQKNKMNMYKEIEIETSWKWTLPEKNMN